MALNFTEHQIGSRRLAAQSGFTLLEMVITLTIMSVLAGASYPLLRNSIIREREIELRQSLREIRQAIDAYKRFSDISGGTAIPIQFRTKTGYPKELKMLAEGFVPANVVGTEAAKVRFLRRLPDDPMTDDEEWGFRSSQDEPDSTAWGGDDIFDVYTKSDGVALNGTKYRDW
ncbi:MAG: type II secretion system protein [Blastocatellia bacterium]